jgi:hypothetical protein
MSRKWQKVFEVSVPVERLWQAFRDEREFGRLLRWPDATPEQAADGARHKVIEAEPLRHLRFERADKGPLPEQRAEFTIVLESTQAGSRFTVTRYGFGEGEIGDAFADANFLGFCHGFADLVFYLETGKAARRHHVGCSQSSTAMVFRERDWGVEVLEVAHGGFAEQAGLARGDRILRIGGVPIYTRNDVWGLTAEHVPETLLSVEYVRGRERLHGAGRLSKPELAAIGE